MAEQEFEELFRKYLNDTMSAEEFLRWKQLLQNENYSQQLEAQLEELVSTDHSAAGFDAPAETMYRQIEETTVRLKRNPFTMRRYLLYAAAAVLLLVGAGVIVQFLNNGKQNKEAGKQLAATSLDIVPGTNGAVLTLADGRKIILDSLQNGVIAMENNSKAILENGTLAYEAEGAASAKEQLNTISTAKGRQFQIRLPDGSRAWLNAASSITYPTSFNGSERRVQITGEVYFEVAKQKDQPFKVQSSDDTFVEVTGTRFNVNAYADEPSMATTVTEGSVNVHAGRRFQAIKPGQQAIVQSAQINLIAQADTSQVLAWKNGVFDMNNAELKSVMRQLARWYDVQIEYEKQPPSIHFGGRMQRNLKLSQVLNGLSGMGVQFRIEEGRKLVVY